MEPSRAEMIQWVKDAYIDWKKAQDAGDEAGKRKAVRKIACRLAFADAPPDLLDDIPRGDLDRHFNDRHFNRSIH